MSVIMMICAHISNAGSRVSVFTLVPANTSSPVQGSTVNMLTLEKTYNAVTFEKDYQRLAFALYTGKCRGARSIPAGSKY